MDILAFLSVAILFIGIFTVPSKPAKIIRNALIRFFDKQMAKSKI